jgi:ABC-2 type transport system permease protein
MRNIWTIAQRELKTYFNSPVAYVIAFMIFLVLGVIFYANILAASVQQMGGAPFVPGVQIIIGPLVTLILFTSPALTMRTIAEEQRMGTLELLLTAPVRDWELVVGKWLGAFLFVLSIIALSWVYPLILNILIDPGIDQGLLVTGYLGLILLSAVFLAIGVAVSSFFSNQIAAFFGTLAILLVTWMISYPAQSDSGTGSEILRYLDLSEHFYYTFFRGVVELKNAVYYLSFTALSLFIGTISIEIRRWR